MAQFWTLIGFISMTVGAIFFGYKASSATNERWRILLTLNFFITAIASVLYLVILTKHGEGTFNDHNSYWVRYVTWILSTPLLLLVLSYLGRSRLSTIGGLLGANTLMLATGFLADIYPKPHNITWYLISCGAYVGVVCILLSSYRAEAERSHPGKVGKDAFQRLLTVHIVLWTAYPIVWILADTGIDAIGDGVESMLYTILDVAAKVGFGLLSISTLKKLEKFPVWADQDMVASMPTTPINSSDYPDIDSVPERGAL